MTRALNIRLLAFVAAFCCFTFARQAAFAQEGLTAKALEGVWQVTRVVKAGVVDTNPQASLAIFSRGYFSIIRVNEPRQPSPNPKDTANLTAEEKIARYNEWASFTASAGLYEVSGNTLITHSVVAKVAGAMRPAQPEEATIKFEGDRFVLFPKSAPGAPPSDIQRTYTRLR
jgi:hypothetical protein